jgi:hypothetical protein
MDVHRVQPDPAGGAGSSPEEFWSLLAESGYRFYSIEGRGELRPIRDTGAYTRLQAESFANIWAVHRAQPEPRGGP